MMRNAIFKGFLWSSRGFLPPWGRTCAYLIAEVSVEGIGTDSGQSSASQNNQLGSIVVVAHPKESEGYGSPYFSGKKFEGVDSQVELGIINLLMMFPKENRRKPYKFSL